MRQLYRITGIILLVCSNSFLFAQKQPKNSPGMELPIRKAKSAMVLDGKLDEQDWKDATVATNFFLNYPVDTAAAPFQTEARMTFDDHAMYVSFVCYDDNTPHIVQSLRRDFEYGANDNVGIYFGPYNDAINGFYFRTTPYGVQSEGTISGAGAEDGAYSSTWDNKWYSHVIKSDDRWVVEMMIPFKSFRFKGELSEWNVTFLRSDLKRNHTSSWIATPIQFIPASFAFSGKLKWVDLPPHHTTNISLIPYIAGGTSADNTTVPVTKSDELQVGFDAKIGVTPSLNLDLTVNPDFSQVEVDRQVINLTRFEFQFPERRQFFLENSDLFDRMGFPDARPFFSRRVGLARDSSGNLKRVPILYGARLSGSLSKKWRLNVMNMQTKEALELGLPSQNFTVAALQRNFWKQSSVQLSLVNKQSLGVGSGDSVKFYNKDLWKDRVSNNVTQRVLNDFNRVLSLDIESRSIDNTWYFSGYYTKSFDSFNTEKQASGGGFLQQTKRHYQIFTGSTFVEKNYVAEAGYVPSRGVYPGVTNLFLSVYGTIYPKNSILVTMRPMLDLSASVIPGGDVTDKSAALGYSFNFLNTSMLTLGYVHTFQQMTNDFSPIDAEKFTNFLIGERYSWNRYSLIYQSDQRKLFKYTLGSTKGGFYNGENLNFNGEISYRYQPYGSVSVRFDYNDLKLPGNYGTEKLFVVSPRFDLTFTKNIFLTTFVQYNTLADNVNLNARFQWRYKPASDFFVVYTENYLPESLVSKSRSLVFKLTYWLNI
ncbi:MAG: carbohydrate binding family 9 domain-containing protein [Cyclobacteriaceae bacterium]|nr:carbohydrate binding family 9 domain-containing protein [Cyclobacteriaceae bacterium]